MPQEFEVVEERFGRAPEPDEKASEERVARILVLGQALSDPIRVRKIM